MTQLSFRIFLKYAEKLHANAIEAGRKGATPYLMGSILLSWIALESFVNNMVQDFAALPEGTFSVHEEAFLTEKQIVFGRKGPHAGRFSVGKNQEYRGIEDKILFLNAKFGGGKIDKGGPLWQEFERVKTIRNILTHYRKDSDIELTIQDSKEAMEIVKAVIEHLSTAIWRKPVNW